MQHSTTPSNTHLTLQALKSANPELFYKLEGEAAFSMISSPQGARSNSLVFAPSKQDFELAYSNGARAFVLGHKMESLELPSGVAALYSKNVQLALAQTSEKYFPDPQDLYHEGPNIHPTATISPQAELHPSVIVGAYSVIGPRVKIGANSYVGPHVVIEGDVTIGKRTSLQPFVFIARRTLIGNDCLIKSHSSLGTEGYGFAHDQNGHHHRIQQTGRVVLEDRVEIGAGNCFDRATFDETRVKEGTKFDNIVHLAHNSKIGRNCLLTGGFMTAGSVTLGDNVVTGGRTSITDHVTICDNVQIGGLSGVSNDVTKPGAYAGYPLLPIKEHLRATASIAALPKIRRDITRILSHLGLKKSED